MNLIGSDVELNVPYDLVTLALLRWVKEMGLVNKTGGLTALELAAWLKFKKPANLGKLPPGLDWQRAYSLLLSMEYSDLVYRGKRLEPLVTARIYPDPKANDIEFYIKDLPEQDANWEFEILRKIASHMELFRQGPSMTELAEELCPVFKWFIARLSDRKEYIETTNDVYRIIHRLTDMNRRGLIGYSGDVWQYVILNPLGRELVGK
jgi:hypothetical protein